MNEIRQWAVLWVLHHRMNRVVGKFELEPEESNAVELVRDLAAELNACRVLAKKLDKRTEVIELLTVIDGVVRIVDRSSVEFASYDGYGAAELNEQFDKFHNLFENRFREKAARCGAEAELIPIDVPVDEIVRACGVHPGGFLLMSGLELSNAFSNWPANPIHSPKVDELLSTEEVCKLLECDNTTLSKKKKSKGFPKGIKKPGNDQKLYYSMTEIQTWLDSKSTETS